MSGIEKALNIDPIGESTDLVETSTSSTALDSVSEALSELSLVTKEEVRGNYVLAQGTLATAISGGLEGLESIRSLIKNAPDNTTAIEKMSMLIRAINESAQMLASIHKDIEDIVPNIKNLEINNTQNLNMDANKVTDLIKDFRKGIIPTVELDEDIIDAEIIKEE